MPDPQEQTPDFIPAEPKAKPSGDADFIPATGNNGATANIGTPPAPAKPGYVKRLGQSLGLPTSEEELKAAQPSWPEIIGGPAVTVGKSILNYAKTAGKGIVEGGKEAYEAGWNIGEGQPVLLNLGKAAMGAMHAILQATPIIGPAIETAGDDITDHNYSGAAGGLTGVIGQVAAPEIFRRSTAKPIPIQPETAARELAKAVNPAVNEWPNYIKATSQEAGNIKAFAQKNNIPLSTQLDWAKAARGAAEEAKGYFQEKVLGPHASEQVSTAGSGFKGASAGEGQNASLGEINRRIGTINDELRSAYQKREAGQTREALANEPDLVAEKNSLTEILHKELAQRTGMTPEQVGGIRQRYGRMYSVADQTDAAVNQRQSSAGKANEGRRDIPLTTSGAIADVVNKIRGGPEGIANKAFVKALEKTKGIPLNDLPPVSPQTPTVRTPDWGRPIWQGIGASKGSGIPIETTAPEELAAQQEKLQNRASSVIKARGKTVRQPIWAK